MPFFSIVVTATRPHLVGYAIRSALAQEFRDFELIVSDNSTEGCRQLVEEFADERIRYVRPLDRLTTVPHWNFAFGQASGMWQLLLCDDDAMAPNLLSVLHDVIDADEQVETISWEFANYTYAASQTTRNGSRFAIPGFTGKAESIAASALIEEMFQSGTGLFGRTKRRIPFVPRSAYARQVVERVRERMHGQLFLPPCPMTSGAAAALAVSKKNCRLDLPLYVIGITADSAAGVTADRSTYDSMHRGVEIELAPVKSMYVFPSANADALLRTQAAMPDELGMYELNMENYFYACHLALDELERAGVDAAPERRLLRDSFDRQPKELIEAVRSQLEHAAREGAVEMRRSVWRRRLWRLLCAMDRKIAGFRGNTLSMGTVVDTTKAGLRDIVDCARYLTRLTKDPISDWAGGK